VGVEPSPMELSLPFPRRHPRGRSISAGPRARARSAPREALAWLGRSRLALRCVLAALICAPLLGGGWLWLRKSSFVSVRHVHIAGVHGPEAIEIRRALDAAATRMTTLDFDPAALRSAVSSFAVVASVRAGTSFPHTASISVSERPPVAALVTAGERTAVAADGTVLGPALLSSNLPVVDGSVEPLQGARLRAAPALACVGVLGAAPPALARYVARAYDGPEGVTVAMRNGLLVYFGDATRPHAKWISLARVLVSPSAAGARYIDVRLPERPAAGFSTTTPTAPSATASAPAAATTPAEGSASTESASNPTAAALAASLANAAGAIGVSPSAPAAGESGSSSPSSPSSSSPGGSGETSSSAETGG
jgi:cell division protein FtsQ